MGFLITHFFYKMYKILSPGSVNQYKIQLVFVFPWKLWFSVKYGKGKRKIQKTHMQKYTWQGFSKWLYVILTWKSPCHMSLKSPRAHDTIKSGINVKGTK